MSKNAAIRQRGDRIQPKSDAKLQQKNGNRKFSASVYGQFDHFLLIRRFPTADAVVAETFRILLIHPTAFADVVKMLRGFLRLMDARQAPTVIQHLKRPLRFFVLYPCLQRVTESFKPGENAGGD